MALTSHLLKYAVQEPGVPNPREVSSSILRSTACKCLQIELFTDGFSMDENLLALLRSRNEQMIGLPFSYKRPCMIMNLSAETCYVRFIAETPTV